MGAVAYMSSEQALGRELDLRSDLFSFGAVLYERWPPVHRPSSAPRIRRYLRRDPSRSAETAIQLNSQLPAQLDQSILKALRRSRFSLSDGLGAEN